jgi:hypothetical protein
MARDAPQRSITRFIALAEVHLLDMVDGFAISAFVISDENAHNGIKR